MTKPKSTYKTEGKTKGICRACGEDMDGHNCSRCLVMKGVHVHQDRVIRVCAYSVRRLKELRISHNDAFLDTEDADQGMIIAPGGAIKYEPIIDQIVEKEIEN